MLYDEITQLIATHVSDSLTGKMSYENRTGSIEFLVQNKKKAEELWT